LARLLVVVIVREGDVLSCPLPLVALDHADDNEEEEVAEEEEEEEILLLPTAIGTLGDDNTLVLALLSLLLLLPLPTWWCSCPSPLPPFVFLPAAWFTISPAASTKEAAARGW